VWVYHKIHCTFKLWLLYIHLFIHPLLPPQLKPLFTNSSIGSLYNECRLTTLRWASFCLALGDVVRCGLAGLARVWTTWDSWCPRAQNLGMCSLSNASCAHAQPWKALSTSQVCCSLTLFWSCALILEERHWSWKSGQNPTDRLLKP
jgi:hypothetical protein